MLAAGASEDIRGLFESSHLPARLEDQICSTYAALCGGLEAPVALRSSATAEDLANARQSRIARTSRRPWLTWRWVWRTVGDKSIAYRFDPSSRGVRAEDIPPALRARPCLTDDWPTTREHA